MDGCDGCLTLLAAARQAFATGRPVQDDQGRWLVPDVVLIEAMVNRPAPLLDRLRGWGLLPEGTPFVHTPEGRCAAVVEWSEPLL